MLTWSHLIISNTTLRQHVKFGCHDSFTAVSIGDISQNLALGFSSSSYGRARQPHHHIYCRCRGCVSMVSILFGGQLQQLQHYEITCGSQLIGTKNIIL